MSAFICGTDHFKALALFCVARQHGSMNVDPRYVEELPANVDQHRETAVATMYANILYLENVRSVECRYPDSSADNLPGEFYKPATITVTAQDVCYCEKYRVSPVAILKMCDCLEYQSCETDDYRSTLAYALLNKIRRAAIHNLPGYDDGPWDFRVSSDKRAAA